MTNDFIDRLGLPEFMKTCACDGSNVEVVCPTCPYKEECDRALQPVAYVLRATLPDAAFYEDGMNIN